MCIRDRPIILENKAIGMLVIEDRRKSNLSARYNQTHFLKIIANILGDARKKILYEERIYNIAYFDETTKLANRNMLKKNLEQILHVRKESEKIVIFDVELGNLRMINDTFGHRIGAVSYTHLSGSWRGGSSPPTPATKNNQDTWQIKPAMLSGNPLKTIL